ncbi:MAG: SemiSWEET family transporter [Patescibacteria group bacterium]
MEKFIEFVEIQNFGFNMLTITFLATLVFTVSQGVALIRQNKTIVKNRSGKSVNFIFFSYYGFSALAVIIYGLDRNSLALTINGFLGFIALAIIFNLLRFKPIKLKEKIVGFSSAIVLPLIIFVPQRDLLFLIFGSIIGVTVIAQIMEIWKNQSSGSVHPDQIIVSVISALFWLGYAIILNIWPMEIVNSIGLILWALLYFSYWKFRVRLSPVEIE